MNAKCIINPIVLVKYNFKHHFSYKLMFYIMTYYDTKVGYVVIDKNTIIDIFNINRHTVANAIDELKRNKIIKRYKHFKDKYTVNDKIFIKFTKSHYKNVETYSKVNNVDYKK